MNMNKNEKRLEGEGKKNKGGGFPPEGTRGAVVGGSTGR